MKARFVMNAAYFVKQLVNDKALKGNPFNESIISQTAVGLDDRKRAKDQALHDSIKNDANTVPVG